MDGTRQRYGMLLVALGATFFFEGIAEPSAPGRLISTLLSAATLLLALRAADFSPKHERRAVLLVALLVVAVLAAMLVGDDRTEAAVSAITSGLLVGLAPIAVVRGLSRSLRASSGVVTLPIVAGVLCLYVLLGLFFAFLFAAIQAIDPSPFFHNGHATSPTALYYSFVTLATLGYGDYTATTNLGHTLSVTEALIGQIYLVTVVAAIVARLVPRRAST